MTKGESNERARGAEANICRVRARASAETAHGYLAPPRMRSYVVRTQGDWGVGGTEAGSPGGNRGAAVVS